MTVPNKAQVEVPQKAVSARRGTTRMMRVTFPLMGARKVENRVKAYTSNLGLEI